jgi:DNA invertase Pin-like site-specific DNA recombinase
MRDANEQDPPTPAVIYAAKSTEDLRGSIATQTTECEAFCAHDGLVIDGVYFDEAKSAYHGSRGDGLLQAREHAERLAAEGGRCALVVQHTDRLARGDGVTAQHLVEILLWARKAGVRIRSVQDDSTGDNLLMAVVMGERNHEDSKRKSAACAAGKRRVAERGEWSGRPPDGYVVERRTDGANVTRRIVVDPERADVYRLLWDLALEGATVSAIVRALNARGFLTRPYSGNGVAKAKPFDASRVRKALNNPFYANLVVSRGEIVGEGHWPHYVEPDDWHRLRRERTQRHHQRREPVGRPPGGLLARLARCDGCGGALVHQRGRPRADGTRRRSYACVTHLHRPEGCSTRPFDAELVERMVLGGLDDLLGEGHAWTDALLAGRDAERGRLQAEADAAAAEYEECDQSIQKLTQRYDAAAMADDENALELASRAVATRRTAMRRASARLQALRDALSELDIRIVGGASEPVVAVLWRSLSGGMEAAGGDVKAMNAVLRETFDAFELSRSAGGLRIQPVLSQAVAMQLLRGPNRLPYRTTVEVKYPSVAMRAVSEPGSGGGRSSFADLVEQDDRVVSISVNGPQPLTDENPPSLTRRA